MGDSNDEGEEDDGDLCMPMTQAPIVLRSSSNASSSANKPEVDSDATEIEIEHSDATDM